MRISIRGPVQRKVGSLLGAHLPRRSLRPFLEQAVKRNPQDFLQVLGPLFNRTPTLATMPFDLPIDGPIAFEHLAGLFASTDLNHSVISLTIREAAYMFGLIRRMQVRKVVEIGRYKGGATLLIAAAMRGEGDFWSIDIGQKVTRLYEETQATYDRQIRATLDRLRLQAHLIIGDSFTLVLDTGPLDLVFIDGDHTYECVKKDFERWGRNVRIGGAVLFDDAYGAEPFRSHEDTVGRLVSEIVVGGDFVLAQKASRMAHLERVK